MMSYATHASTYREAEVMSASPGQLVILLYDHLLVNLRRAGIAMQAGNVDLRIQHFDKARAVLSELLTTLDHEKGGAIAAQLSGLYTFLLGELIDVGSKSDTVRLERIVGMVSELREAFATIAGVASNEPVPA